MSDEKNNARLKALESLLAQNVELTKDLQRRVKKIHTYIHWQRIFFVVKLLLILVPLILGIIYLPPLLEETTAPYREFFNTMQGAQSTGQGFDINTFINEFAN